ncbi:MAG TPA: hypothetical protein VFL85_00785 [Candidatus Saccharimonadales bacterium]|nr:hypothetical protein [Candidatus Saccharimonadales bacterium]
MRRTNQKGFAVIESIIILIIVVAIAGAGYYVYQHRQKPDQAASNQSAQTKKTAKVDNGLNQSTSPTFYDCLDTYNKHITFGADGLTKAAQPKVYNFNDKTGVCTMQGKTYAFPTAFTDDDIRNTAGMKFTAKEADYLRRVGTKNFKNCLSGVAPDQHDMLPVIDMYGEAGGKFLYYGVGCDSGHREIAVLQNGDWKVVSSGQMGVDCKTITQYNIPHSMFTREDDSSCTDFSTGKEIPVNKL